MKKTFKIILNTIYAVVVLYLSLFIIISLAMPGKTTKYLGFGWYKVASGSMEPMIMTEDVIVAYKVLNPYELKDGGLIYIKPILVKDYLRYSWAKEILSIEKNEINDIEIIQMSYLEFLIKKVFTMNKESEDKLRWLIKLCMDEDYVAFVDNKIYICEQDTTIKAIIRPKEFDDISKIIQSQNDPNYDDRYVSPEVKELMQDYYKTK